MTLVEMRPTTTVSDVRNQRLADAELLGEHAMGLAIESATPDRDHLLCSKSRSRMALAAYLPIRSGAGSVAVAARTALPPFGIAVTHVGQMVAEEEVIGSYAARTVAPMQYVEPIWYRTVGQFVGDTVSSYWTSSYSEDSVAFSSRSLEEGSRPEPAVTGCVDLRPESVGNGSANASVHNQIIHAGDRR